MSRPEGLGAATGGGGDAGIVEERVFAEGRFNPFLDLSEVERRKRDLLTEYPELEDVVNGLREKIIASDHAQQYENKGDLADFMVGQFLSLNSESKLTDGRVVFNRSESCENLDEVFIDERTTLVKELLKLAKSRNLNEHLYTLLGDVFCLYSNLVYLEEEIEEEEQKAEELGISNAGLKFYDLAIESAGEVGFAPAKYRIHQYYLDEEEKEKESAENIAKLAKRTGYYLAEGSLAGFCERGEFGFEKNLKEAFEIYSSLAVKEYPEAIYRVALFHGEGVVDEGLGLNIERNLKEAFQHYLVAAKNGHAQSQYLVGKIYSRGYGVVEVDEKKAFEYFNAAASQNHELSKRKVVECYREGFGVKLDLSKAEALEKEYFPEIEESVVEEESEHDRFSAVTPRSNTRDREESFDEEMAVPSRKISGAKSVEIGSAKSARRGRSSSI